MAEFLIRRGGFWLLQWARLTCACIGIATFGYVDLSLKAESAYLDLMDRQAIKRAEVK